MPPDPNSYPPDPTLYYRLAVKLGPLPVELGPLQGRQQFWGWKYLTAKCLNSRNGESIVQYQKSEEFKQVWQLIPVQEGKTDYFYLVLRGDGRCLQRIYKPGEPEDNYVKLSKKIENDDRQQWRFMPINEDQRAKILGKGIPDEHKDWKELQGKLSEGTVRGYFITSKSNEETRYPFLGVDGNQVANDTKICFGARKKENIYNLVWALVPQLLDDDKNGKDTVKPEKTLFESFKNLIFQGPPGTSKTYNAKLLAASVVLGEDDNQKLEQAIREKENLESAFSKARFPGKGPKGSWSIVQFHPAYNYEDFVRGIEVKGNGTTVSYNAVRRIFDRMAQAAWKAYKAYREDAENCPKYVLIIDEINRAHLAAVLGELIYALEYRGSPVDSPYAVQEDGEESTQIIVPPNLYIIGTMNTADRSIGHIDYAVRRRFAFVPLLPEEGPINSGSGKKLFHEIAKLFKVENGKRARTLSPEFHADDVQPGHTYFITSSSEKPAVVDELANKFAYQVYPLLREYFKDGILINSPELFNGKLGLDIPRPPQEGLEIVKSFLNGS